MRITIDKSNIDLIEKTRENDQLVWKVRWDIQGNELDGWDCEEMTLSYCPTIEEIQQEINNWQNKQIDGSIQHGFMWNNMKVLLTEENRNNFGQMFNLAHIIDSQIRLWDEANPELAGQNAKLVEYKDSEGNIIPNEDGTPVMVSVPTGRPESVLPLTFKLGDDKEMNFYTFETLEELTSFYTAGVNHVNRCYNTGWTNKAQFDYTPYQEALDNLQ